MEPLQVNDLDLYPPPTPGHLHETRKNNIALFTTTRKQTSTTRNSRMKMIIFVKREPT